MANNQIYDRMTYILSGSELDRIHVYNDVDGMTVLRIDLHLMTRKAVKKLLDETILLMRFPFRLDLIHGFKNGTVLKDMIEHEYSNERITDMYIPEYNPGETFLEVA